MVQHFGIYAGTFAAVTEKSFNSSFQWGKHYIIWFGEDIDGKHLFAFKTFYYVVEFSD